MVLQGDRNIDGQSTNIDRNIQRDLSSITIWIAHSCLDNINHIKGMDYR